MASRTPWLSLPAFALLSIACADKAANQVAVVPPPPETVYVRQPEPAPAPPPPLPVSPRFVLFDAIGDTMRLALPDGSDCVSASETVAQVSEHGLVRAAGNGETHLRCWMGDQNASIRVNVAQKLARVAVVSEEGLALRKSGDTLTLALARVDRLGTPVANAPSTWTSLTPEVVRVDPSTGVAAAVADSGVARIVGIANQFADTVLVEVGIKRSTPLLSSRSTTSSLSRARNLARAQANRRLGNQPGAITTQSVTTPSAQQQAQGPGQGIGARQATPRDSLFQDPATGLMQGSRALVPTVMAGFAEYRISTTANGLEKTSGAVYGAEFGITTGGLLSFRLNFLTGTLSKDTTTVQRDRKFSSASLDGSIAIAPWLNIVAGAEARRFQDLTTQRWVMVRAGGEANFNLGGTPLRGIARLQLMPLISISSDAVTTNPSFGVASVLGLGYENRRISSSLVYDIERFSFSSNTGRKEQFGALLFRFGIKF